MRYFFDIHLHGKCHLDDRGEEFNSAEEAREYVVDCGRTCMIEGQPHERRTMAQCIIEVTDCEGLSDLLTMADVLPPISERAIKKNKFRHESVYPGAFVWRAHREGPSWVLSCCVALACGVGGYYLASPSQPLTEKIEASLEGTRAAQSFPTKDEDNPAAVKTWEDTRAPVTPVVLNPGAGDNRENVQPKETSPPVTKSRATNAQHARRSADNGADSAPPSRHQPTAYRSYKDLRNFTLNR